MREAKLQLLSTPYTSSFYNEVEYCCLILLYHGVTRHCSFGIENVQCKHVQELAFLEQMKIIKNSCNVISIDEFIEINNNSDKFPPRSVVVSFDDGFKNNFEVACPILDELQIPAIFYITSGIVDTNKMFWVDVVEDALNLCKKKSIKLNLDKDFIFDLQTNESKVAALRQVKKFCKSVPKYKQEQVVRDLVYESDVIPSVDHSPNYEKLTWGDLCEMDRNALFTVGGHSLNHNVLSQLTHNDLLSDIAESLRLLRLKLNHHILHYSYPEGGPEHYNQTVIDCLKNEKIKCCPTAEFGLNSVSSDLFRVKRIMIGFEGLQFPLFSDLVT